MAEHSIDRKKVRHDLKIARTKLFGQFLKHPKDARLALAVRIIDDQIASCSEWSTYKAAVMQDKTGVDQKASDAQLIALLRKTEEEVEAHGELNESNRLHDFASELIKRCWLRKVG